MAYSKEPYKIQVKHNIKKEKDLDGQQHAEILRFESCFCVSCWDFCWEPINTAITAFGDNFLHVMSSLEVIWLVDFFFHLSSLNYWKQLLGRKLGLCRCWRKETILWGLCIILSSYFFWFLMALLFVTFFASFVPPACNPCKYFFKTVISKERNSFPSRWALFKEQLFSNE